MYGAYTARPPEKTRQREDVLALEDKALNHILGEHGLGRALYATILAIILLGVALITPVMVYQHPVVKSLLNTCIKDPEQLRALLVEYNSTIRDEFRLLRDATRPVVVMALNSSNPLVAVNNAVPSLAEKYWRDVANLVLGIEKAYYAAEKYYQCTGNAEEAAKILAEIALNKPAKEIPGSTIAQVVHTLKTMNVTEAEETIKVFEKALEANDPTPIRSYVENMINYILFQELRSALLGGH